ncbi:MAG: hypothetical protein IJO32_07970 [Bacilli bacterium]|nr:hypothetical protein [Bacilli bacterium]
MRYNVQYKGYEVYRNLFTSIIKPDNQDNVRTGYVRYIVLNDNNVVMTFACKDTDEPWHEYLKRK